MEHRLLAVLAAAIVIGGGATYSLAFVRSDSPGVELTVSSAVYGLTYPPVGSYYLANVTVADASLGRFVLYPANFKLVTDAGGMVGLSSYSALSPNALQPVALGKGQNVSGSVLFEIPANQTARELEYSEPNLTATTSALPSPRWQSLVSPSLSIVGGASQCISNAWIGPTETSVLSGKPAGFNLTFTISYGTGCDRTAAPVTLVSVTANPQLAGQSLSPGTPVVYPSAGCMDLLENALKGCQKPTPPNCTLRLFSCDGSAVLEVTAPNYSAMIKLNVTLDFEYQG